MAGSNLDKSEFFGSDRKNLGKTIFCASKMNKISKKSFRFKVKNFFLDITMNFGQKMRNSERIAYRDLFSGF